MTLNQTPAYNLKVVLNETGLKPDVLRAWERRYGLPNPRRTPGGHRLYSEYDIETIKWLRARQQEGLSISHAVELWNSSLAKGFDPLVSFQPANQVFRPPILPALDTHIDNLRQDWLSANLAFNSTKADEVLNQAFAIYPIETVCTEILQQGLSEIGHLWYQGNVSVQQEHFATAESHRRLETLLSATPPPTRQQLILLGCPPGEMHTFSILLLNLFLRRRGLQVIYLGADIPTQQLAEATRTIKPDLLVLSAQQLSTAASLRRSLHTLQSLGIPLTYGGLIFNRVPSIRERIPGIFLGETIPDAVTMIEQLVVTHPNLSSQPVIEAPQDQLARLYSENRPRIEALVNISLSQDAQQTEFIATANAFFGNALAAALELGDPAYLEADMQWLKKLLTNRALSSSMLNPYFSAYHDAVEDILGESGSAIISWIDHHLVDKPIDKLE